MPDAFEVTQPQIHHTREDIFFFQGHCVPQPARFISQKDQISFLAVIVQRKKIKEIFYKGKIMSE